jgi:hypothetical protein
MEEFPCNLEGNRGLAGAGSEGEQDARALVRDGFKDALDGRVLVVANVPRARTVLEGNLGKAFPPGIRNCKGCSPEFVRRRKMIYQPFGGVDGDRPIVFVNVGSWTGVVPRSMR